MAGVKLPAKQPVDGRSWVPLLSGKKAPNDRAVFWHYPLYLAGGTYNEVVPVHGTENYYWRATPCSVIRKGDWKLIKYDVLNGQVRETQLFNLKTNPHEFIAEHRKNQPDLTNLAKNPKYDLKQKEMEALLASEMKRLDDPFRLWDQAKD